MTDYQPTTEAPAEDRDRAIGTSSGDDIHPEDADDEWATGPARTGIRLRVMTGALVVLITLAGGFWGGAVVEKHHGSGSSSSSISALAASASPQGSGPRSGLGAGTGLGSGAGKPATSGRVADLSGDVVDVTDSTGASVKVAISASTTIIRVSTRAAGPIQIGDNLVVRGTKNADGSVAASSVTATSPSVASGSGAPTGG
jgi:ribosomal protein S28E/S33